MSLFHNFLIFFIITSAFSFNPLSAWCEDSYLDLVGGYRNNDDTVHLQYFDSTETMLLKSDIKVHGFATCTAGAKWRFSLPTCDSFYFRGDADFGWIVGQGQYREEVTNVATGQKTEVKANVHGGTAINATGGIGYLFQWSNFGIGPVGGYSYNIQRMSWGHNSINGQTDPNLQSLRNTYLWEGPWVGLDFIYNSSYVLNWGYLTVSGGYEYHWARWQSKFKLKVPDTLNGDFSDVRNSENGHGHSGYLSARWNFDDCWHMGVSAIYQHFIAHKGTLRPLHGSFSSVNSTITSAKVPESAWDSIDYTLEIGLNF